MSSLFEKVTEASSFLAQKWDKKPVVAIILGSGFSSFVGSVKVDCKIDYSQIPNSPKSLVEHHKGELVLGTLSGEPVMVFNGRFHLYEGHSASDVAFPVRLAKACGVETVIVTNSAGSLVERIKSGDIAMITDQINLTGQNPLTGDNDYRFGPRFPSMHNPYSKVLQELVAKTAEKCSVKLQTGVYAGVNGPSLETPAEANMLTVLGADLVGMSTVFETIVAVQSKMEVIGLSVVTDSVSVSSKEFEEALKPAEAKKAFKIAKEDINKLIKKVVEKLCAKNISNQ
jgi:purine-nucleoside phosphorylase